MDAVLCSSRIVAGGDEASDSDDGDWDVGVVRQEPQQLDQMLQADKHEALKKALFCGDVALIEELLNSGISIETSFQFGWTPLMCAASVANFAVVRLLLDRGANACFEIDKYTVLMAACTAQASEENILNTVELLLSRNADPNLACRKQMTALMYAARKGYPRVVAFLVAHGADINAQDENGYTIFSMLSLATNHLQGRYHKTTEQEATCKFVTVVPDYSVGSCSTFHDMEVFLHGLGLEHIRELLKEQDIPLRQLLTMQKDDLIQIGITNPGDQQKLLDAINDLQVKEKKFEDVSEITKLELSEDELLRFLQKLNKECSKLMIPVQTMNNHFLKNSHKMVLQWAPTECYIEVCKDVICSVKKLEEEVGKLKDLVVEYEEKTKPKQVKLPRKAATLEKRLVKMGVVTLLGFGFFIFVIKLVAKRTRI
ncbi:ankyrin repeat, SAM and basic leucine zipper domain-containing protein 1 isoform X3 [Oenanthe melanoleuca]|uniref:ankyrin repeat, SAM and basic leucine zipper domain-containing protein 1 isoform X3 n=1 Tax=Oenanthe melanoleuca TaxID=2939378 RepID=UPI0024C1C78D|nr:ankyrin repeat, SAM and basic leucine zipper domain-containing protein 1 isoform X3 [Oenanthe melanoleuca]